jgi:excisionase family DNA binding protein
MPVRPSSARYVLPAPALYTIAQFAVRANLSTRLVARLVANGSIPSIEIGRLRRIVPAFGMAALRGSPPSSRPVA